MSSKYSSEQNTYCSLISATSWLGCRTSKEKKPWIQANFGSMVYVISVELAPLESADWGSKYLNGSVLSEGQQNRNNKYVEVTGFTTKCEKKIFEMNCKTDSIRICGTTNNGCWLGVGYFKIRGHKLSNQCRYY
eukprot:512227_1